MGGLEVKLHSFSTSVQHGGERSISSPRRFTPGKTTLVPNEQGLGGPQRDMDTNLLLSPAIKPRFVGHPARILVTTPIELPQLSSADDRRTLTL